MVERAFSDRQRQKILDGLREGRSMRDICQANDLPCREVIRLLEKEDPDFAAAVHEAREDGYAMRAEQAVKDAKNATDAALGRLAFDAERWHLGKLSHAFSDNKAQRHEHSGPDGAPIETRSKLDVAGLNDDQLRALASIPVQSE